MRCSQATASSMAGVLGPLLVRVPIPVSAWKKGEGPRAGLTGWGGGRDQFTVAVMRPQEAPGRREWPASAPTALCSLPCLLGVEPQATPVGSILVLGEGGSTEFGVLRTNTRPAVLQQTCVALGKSLTCLGPPLLSLRGDRFGE